MTQEEKDLLLKDLSARLPYGVKISIPDLWTQQREIEILDEIFKGDDELYRVNSKGQCIEHIKPYLFPLSSMTEEQREELHELWDFNMSAALDCAIYGDESKSGLHQLTAAKKVNEWCYENHFDINGLIPMELANDATGLNIYTNYDNN